MRIRPVVHAVIRDGERILVSHGVDQGRSYYRSLGGGIEIGERSHEALRRELREELGVELSRVDLLGVLENIFEFEGRQHHEIVFAFDVDVANRSFYDIETHDVIEDGVVVARASWMPVADFVSGAAWLVPDGLIGLIAR